MEKMKADYLVRASHLARRGNYDGAIKLLEPEVNRYRNSFAYYYLLAVSYLYAKVYGMAYTYFDLARKIKMRDTSTLLGLACLYLNHGDTDRAVDIYLEVQDLDGKNPIARKALKIIRKYPGPENISAWIDSGKLHTIFPPFPKVHLQWGKIAGLAAAVVLLAGFGVFFFGGFYPVTDVPRMDLSDLVLLREDENAPMQTEGSFRYVLTRDQVLSNYNEARRFFSTYHDEEARVRLNRILESNGPEPIKNKSRLLLSYLEQEPRFDTLKERFTYSQVFDDPFLYRNCVVIWRGTATNLDIEQNHTSLDFLVGYDTRRTLEGIVRVDFDFAVAINPERTLEILGKVIPVLSDRGIDLRIQGIAVNQAGLLDQTQTQ